MNSFIDGMNAAINCRKKLKEEISQLILNTYGYTDINLNNYEVILKGIDKEGHRYSIPITGNMLLFCTYT